MVESNDSGGSQVSTRSAESAREHLEPQELQARAGGIVEALTQAVAQDLIGRAAQPVKLTGTAGHCCSLAEIHRELSDTAEVFRIALRDNTVPAGRLALLVADHSATALARLALPEMGERSPQRIAQALHDCGERAAQAIARLLRLRSDGRLDAWLPPTDAVDDANQTDDDERPWLRQTLELHAEGLETIGLQLICDTHSGLLLANGWRGAATPQEGQQTAILPCFLDDEATFQAIARAARGLGLRAEHHPRGEAPNPSACPSGIVTLDVPVGQERRFAWCQRLKQRREDLLVLLLLHHPSKARVLRACLAHADEILGWPAEDVRVVERLRALQRRQEQLRARR